MLVVIDMVFRIYGTSYLLFKVHVGVILDCIYIISKIDLKVTVPTDFLDLFLP